jgi:signal transduction histidine kinase
MPEIDGLQVLKEIRSNNKYKDLQIIMFTSVIEKEALKRSFEYGAMDFVNKPIEPVEFISRVKNSMRVREYNLILKENLKQIRKQNQELKDLNEKLEETQQYLIQKEKLSAIGELAAGVAHEINNPLGYVSSNTETLEQYMLKFKELIQKYRSLVETINNACTQNTEINNSVEEIYDLEKKLHIDFVIEDVEELMSDTFNGIERVTKIVQTLKNFARLETKEEFDLFSFNDIMEDTLLLANNETKYTIDIEKDFKELPLVPCNKNQISQVFLNIIINAAQAIKSQNRKDRGLIKVATSYDDKYVVCRITDDGPGIKEEIISKIFNPFFTTKDVGAGTGLGLSISYDIIVNKHEGEIFVESEDRQGTTFTIRIPIERKGELKE